MRFRLGLLGLMAIATILRFCWLDGKLLWIDEVLTALRLSGYDGIEVINSLYTAQPIAMDQWWKFQSLNPEHGLLDTVRSLAVAGAQHPPLYFSLLYFWAHGVGVSSAALRSLSAVFALACLPAAYGLGREAFGQRATAGWLLAALVATSPFHSLYAQTARQTSLWTLLLLGGTWALLRAWRLGRRRDWWAFGLLTGLSLYTTPLALLVLLGQAGWVLQQYWIQPISANSIQGNSIQGNSIQGNPIPQCSRIHRRKLRAFAGAAGLAGVSFLPWAALQIAYRETTQLTTHWMQFAPSGSPLFYFWLAHLQRIWVDVYPWLDPNQPLRVIDTVGLVFLAGLMVGMSVWAGRDLWRSGQQPVVYLTASLGILPFLAAALPDVLGGGQRSAQIRYLMPVVVGLQLLVAGGIALRLEPGARWRRRVQLGTIALLLVGLLSFGRGLNQPVWWTQFYLTRGNPAAIAFLNQRCPSTQRAQSCPKIISNRNPAWPFSLARYLNPKIDLILLSPKTFRQQVTPAWLKALPPESYFYNPEPDLRQHLQSLGWELVLPPGWKDKTTWLWVARSR